MRNLYREKTAEVGINNGWSDLKRRNTRMCDVKLVYESTESSHLMGLKNSND